MRSIGANAVVLLLKMIRRKRIYASVSGLMKGIAETRASAPARPSERMRKALTVLVASIEGREVYTLGPRHRAPSGKHVFYLHGGAYVRPISRQHWQFLAYLVQSAGCTVTVPLYPLAPENKCPDILRFVQHVFLRMTSSTSIGNVTLMGDSAGAGMSVALALMLRDQGLPMPAQLALITPWVDATLNHSGIPGTETKDPMLGVAGVREAGRMYAGALPVQHPFVSPAYADLSKLPAMTVFAGTHDILHHDAVLFAQKAQGQGCQVDLRLRSGMIHAWPLLPFPEAKQAREEIARLL